jgi:hypothetical protein
MASSILTSVITGGTNSHQSVSEEFNAYATDFVVQGCWGTITLGTGSSAGTGSFAVSQDSSPDMGITVASGVAYVSCTPSGQDAQVLRARMTANYTEYTINSNSSGSTKYDWIYLQANATNASQPDLAADNVINLYTSRSSSNTADNGSPPTYGIHLATVTVVNGASSITNTNIADARVQAQISPTNSGLALSQTGWNNLGYSLTYSANNGSKEFVATSANNLTSILSPGMKLQVTRSITPPTQCMAFTAASSQYATLASPTGITFTSAFTCEAWIYLRSYTGQPGIITRTDNSTGGFGLQISTTGQVNIFYGGSSAFTNSISYQSIPLNQLVHVAGVVSSVSSKTALIYINGTSVPLSQSGTGTTLAQTGNLTVGAIAVGASGTFFDGYISEARVWSVAQSQSSIQANMGISISGSATNLVAYFQGNGNFNDGTSNANNLTAAGGAIATQSTNPYNPVEYFTILAISYSNPTTTLTLDGGLQNVLPNQTLTTPYYSSARLPYALPANLTKYTRYIPVMNSTSTSNSAQTQWNGLAQTMTIPVGYPRVKITVYSRDAYVNTGTAYLSCSVWDGTVGSGTQLEMAQVYATAGSTGGQIVAVADTVLASGSHTFNAALASSANNITAEAATTYPSYLKVEVDV